MVCMNCGTENQDGVKFCAGCGAQIVETYEEKPTHAPRASRPAKKKFTFGMVQLLVAVVSVLVLIFGVVHLFVDYVVETETVTDSVDEDGNKEYMVEEGYVYKSMIYKTIDEDVLQEAKDAISAAEAGEDLLEGYYGEDVMDAEDSVERDLSGSLSWVRVANVLGGIFCILVACIGVFYVLKDLVPVYDLAFGKIFKGRTALFVMGLGSVATFVLHWLLNAFGGVSYEEISEVSSMEMDVSVSVHWTVWALLIVGVLAVVYEMTALSRKKK